MWRKQPEDKPSAVTEPPRPSPSAGGGPAPAPEPRVEGTRITAAITLKGEISGNEDLFLDGALEGSIRMPDSRVTIGPNARVAADVEADEIVVEGRVTGNLRARTRVELRRTSHVRGDLSAQRIAIQDGACFNGKAEVLRGDTRAPRAASAAAGAESGRAFSNP